MSEEDWPNMKVYGHTNSNQRRVRNMKIEAGHIVLLTSGIYSDFGIEGFIYAVKPFDIDEQIKLFAEERKATDKLGEDYWAYEIERGQFPDWLVEKGLATKCKYVEHKVWEYSSSLLRLFE